MPGRAGRNRNKDPHFYWNNIASTKPEAQSLATSLGLDLPSNDADNRAGSTGNAGLIYPIRRLIITGEDNPANFTTLLGPLWESKTKEIIKQTRLEVLLCPPPGSPSHNAAEYYDAGSPRWTPRSPNAEEREEMGKVNDMERRIAAQMVGRKEASSEDIKDMLTGLGSNWADALPAFQAAMNNRNQGVGR